MNEAAAAAQRDSLSFAKLPGRASAVLQSHERKSAKVAETEPEAQSPAPVAQAATDVEAGVQSSTAASTAEIDIDVDVSDYELEDFTDLVEKVGPDSIIPQTAKPASPAPTPARRLGKRTLIAGATTLAVVACLVVVAVFAFSDVEEAGSGSNGSTDRTQPRPAVAETSPPAPETETEEVTIVLSGLPQGAQIKVDGEVASSPITVSKSTEPVVVEARAAGYAPFEKRVVPDMDREIVVTMDKNPEPVSVTKPDKKTAKKTVKPSKKKKKRGKRAGKSKKKGLAVNPWQ